MGQHPDPGPWVEGIIEGRRGTLVHRKKQRAVWRVEEGGEVWFAKRGTGPKRRELRTEADNLARLAAADVPVAPLLAAGALERSDWLVTSGAPGRELAAALEEAVTDGNDDNRRALLASAARICRRLFDAGFATPDLSAGHLFVDEGTDPVGVQFIDVARLEKAHDEARARSVAQLLFSLPWGCASAHDRARMVDEAGATGLSDLIDRRMTSLRLRTRWRHGYAGASVPVRSALTALQGRPPCALYDALLDPTGMEIVRRLPDRENRRFEGSGGLTYFMKVYPAVRRGLSPAMRESAAIDLFERAEVPTCAAEAYGEDVERGSFLVVRGCDGKPLDDLLREGVTVAERRELCRDTARIWRRMRECGLRHRDAYACHVFAHRTVGGFELRLIDMTRAGRAPFPKERWFVKDAAALWHGAPRPPVTHTDAVRWLRAYFGIPKLDATAKRFARRVAAKERKVARRQQRKAPR